MKALLVSPPWRTPTHGTLAIATLRPLLEARGHRVDELHGALLFPADADVFKLAGLARYLFGRAFGDRDREAYADEVVASVLDGMNERSIVSADEAGLASARGVDLTGLRAHVLDAVGKADVCLARILAKAIADGPYDVVGFSTMFDDQVPAAVAVARGLRAAWPDVRIAFGGPACFEEQADGLLAMFGDAIDAVCHAEGEDVVVPLFEALAAGGDLGAVPGVAYREGAAIVRTASPPLLRDMDRLPVPDYREFVAQVAASEWRRIGTQLFFETSRGCWWGQKSLCTFCGLNGGGLAFRSKSPGRAYDEIAHLYRAYPSVELMFATDNILDMAYLKDVFPRLARMPTDAGRPLRLFYEVKSNMRREQIEAMAAGGVTSVQPGIESFSDAILDVMRKGCTALGQIQFIKWAHQSGTQPSYNLLVLNPGETTAAYEDMVELIPFLTHLPPPDAIVTMLLERFSPYFADPEAHGIRDVRPKRFYRVVFGGDVDPRLAYQFDYEHAMFADERHLATVRRVVGMLCAWQRDYRSGGLYYVEDERGIVIVDRRAGAEVRAPLFGSALALFRFVDQHRTLAAILEAVPGTPRELVEATLEVWLHRRWLCRVGDRYLSVVPRIPGARPRVRAPEPEEPRAPVRLRLVS